MGGCFKILVSSSRMVPRPITWVSFTSMMEQWLCHFQHLLHLLGLYPTGQCVRNFLGKEKTTYQAKLGNEIPFHWLQGKSSRMDTDGSKSRDFASYAMEGCKYSHKLPPTASIHTAELSAISKELILIKGHRSQSFTIYSRSTLNEDPRKIL